MHLFLDELSNVVPNHMPDAPPVMLDLYSGPNAPLAKAFNWCGWRVVTPVDLERDAELDVSTWMIWGLLVL